MGITVRGFCQLNGRDELGKLPPDIARDLIDCEKRGYRTPWQRTLELADAVAILVPKRTAVLANPGFDTLLDLVRERNIPSFTMDPGTDVDALVRRLLAIPHHNPYLSLMVTGPRETRWSLGERIGFDVVSAFVALRERQIHRVLVVDDSRETASRLAQTIRALGHQCDWATSGQDALARGASLKPDVAIVSTRLGDVTGYELARQLRMSDPSPVFLVATDSSDDTGAVGRAYSAGFNHHVMKPLLDDVLLDVMARATTWLPTAPAGPTPP